LWITIVEVSVRGEPVSSVNDTVTVRGLSWGSAYDTTPSTNQSSW